jgi:dihydropyrimidinase
MYDIAVVNGLVYFDNRFHKTNVYIKDGVIENISPLFLKANDIYDCEGNLVLPGIIDPHTHFQLSLGRISSRDDFLYGTKAAAFGGITTIIDFLEPVNNALTLETAFKKRMKQAKKSVVDYKFHACLKDPKNELDSITDKMAELGLNTVKIFTTYSESKRRTYDNEILRLLELSREKDFLVTAHIENDEMIIRNTHSTYMDLSDNRPTISETSEALKLANYVKETDGNLYMVHLSSGETLYQLKERYSDIINDKFIIESCPHYFVFNKDKLKEDDGYLYTMAPPLRSENERKKLVNLIDYVHVIGTDHCSFNRRDKNHRYLNEIPLGVGGVEESFSILYSMFGDKIIDKMTKNVAKVHKLFPQKGIIQEGSDGDLFVYKLGERVMKRQHGYTDYSIYKDLTVNGEVISTLSRGKFIVKNGVFINRKGKLLNDCGDIDESD